jgi:formate/nitrite transporter
MGGGEVMSLVKGPKEAYLTLADKGKVTCDEKSMKVFGQSFIAGCYIGFGALLAVKIAGSMPGATGDNPGLKSLIFAFLFPVNLVLIILTGGILFTGTSAAAPAALYEGKAKPLDVARVLALSWWGNVLGSLLFAAFTCWCELNDGPTGEYAAAIAYKKTASRFDVTIAKGIGCNWMVCMAVFLSGQAQDFSGKCVAIYLPISTFVMIGFEHIPANFYLLELAMLNGDVEFVDVLVKNWIPTTIGNLIAGALIVALFYSYIFGRLGNNATSGSDRYIAAARKSMGMDADPSADVEAALKGDVDLSAQAPQILPAKSAPPQGDDDSRVSGA